MDLFKGKRPIRKKPSLETFLSGRKQLPVNIKTDYDNYFPEDFITIHTGRFNGYTIIIDDRAEMKHIYGNGFFGKGCLSKRWPNFGEAMGGVPPAIRRTQWLRRLQWDSEIAQANLTDTDSTSADNESASNSLPEQPLKNAHSDDPNVSDESGEPTTKRGRLDVTVKQEPSNESKPCMPLFSHLRKAKSDEKKSQKRKPSKPGVVMTRNACVSEESFLNNILLFTCDSWSTSDVLNVVPQDKASADDAESKPLVISSSNEESLVMDVSEIATSGDSLVPSVSNIPSERGLSQATDITSDKNNQEERTNNLDSVVLDVTETTSKCSGSDVQYTVLNVPEMPSTKNPSHYEVAKFLTGLSTSGFAPEQRLAATLDCGQVTVSGANVSSTNTVMVLPDSDDEGGEPTLECSGSSGGIVESLHLLPEEAFFLAWALGVLHVVDVVGNVMSLRSLWRALCEVHPNFVATYAAYHHYRSQGWVVKSGIQFGGQFVLYEKGPAFNHSSYIVRVCSPLNDKSRQFKLSHSLTRTAASANKVAVLCTIKWSADLDLSEPACMKKISASSMVIQRFIASENRDEDDD